MWRAITPPTGGSNNQNQVWAMSPIVYLMQAGQSYSRDDRLSEQHMLDQLRLFNCKDAAKTDCQLNHELPTDWLPYMDMLSRRLQEAMKPESSVHDFYLEHPFKPRKTTFGWIQGPFAHVLEYGTCEGGMDYVTGKGPDPICRIVTTSML